LANAGGFLATFLLVATVWGIYSGKQLSLISITTPIDFRNIPENLVLMNASTEKVEVQITGRRRLVSGLQPEQVEAFLDLKGITFGVHPLVLNQESIELPLGLEVVRLTPPTVRVEMEQRVEKRVAVTPKLEGSPPAGYEIDKVNVKPESVKVSGALSILQATSSLFTEPIDLATIEPGSGEMTVEVPLVLSSASLRLLAGESKDVRVDVELRSHRTDSDDQKEAKSRYHLVRSGDTLWGIGRRYGLTVEELRRLNELKPGTAIYPDQKLSLGPER
jgi:YbbR domain-containing protein